MQKRRSSTIKKSPGITVGNVLFVEQLMENSFKKTPSPVSLNMLSVLNSGLLIGIILFLLFVGIGEALNIMVLGFLLILQAIVFALWLLYQEE